MSPQWDDGPGEHERTMVVDARTLKRSGSPAPQAPPAPAKPSKPWRPFTFSRLEKVSLDESRLSGRLKWVTPKDEAVEALCARLKAIFDAQVGFTLESLRVLGASELRRNLAEPTFLAFVVPGPHRGRAVLEVELALAHAVVDMLLGGAGETVGLRPLTDIEEGVLSFVLLEALKALAPGLEPGQPKPRMEGVTRGVEEAATRLSEDGPVLVVQLRARLGGQEGMVRLFLPAGVLEAMEPAQLAEQRRSQMRKDIEAHLGRLSSARAWLRAEIGYAEISSQDLSGLRVKDVVLVDALSTRLDRGENGTARLRLGLGQVGCLNAEVFLENDVYQARITELVLGEPSYQRRGPSESDEAAEEELGNREQNNLESGAVDDRMDAGDLLGDIPLQISVELARVPVTADQVVAMRVGHVLELNKAPGEPVDLSVNGKVVARGELVEVEGHLGVRIISLAG
ncbi:MAG TPA: type III secretion system cytoplasmic ring protein SctQ [Myxococcaceae bacterium]|nr:type III secretion system cytoplasmic ring protein SctQ [Myxococcaceae bacterium]